MGRADTITKKYMRKNEVFADAFNFLIFRQMFTMQCL